MKLTAVLVLISLAAGAAVAAAAGTRSASTERRECGGELWRLKTFSDPAAEKGGRRGRDDDDRRDSRASIAPGVRRSDGAPRIQHTWEVVAQITHFGSIRRDQSARLYDHNSYINAVIPSPNCLSVARVNDSTSCRLAFLRRDKCGKATTSWQSLGAIFYVRGVGFWGSRAACGAGAPNGAELHPVTGLRVVAGCAAANGPRRAGAAPAAATRTSTLLLLTVEADLAAVRLDDWRASTSPRPVPQIPRSRPTSPRKNFVKICSWCSAGMPSPSIADPDPGLFADERRAHFDDATLGRVLDRVREQVADHLGEPIAIAPDDERRHRQARAGARVPRSAPSRA